PGRGGDRRRGPGGPGAAEDPGGRRGDCLRAGLGPGLRVRRPRQGRIGGADQGRTRPMTERTGPNDIDDPMTAEFDTVAEWTAQVAADLGPEYYVPAACRGSGQPVALDWLLDGLRPGPDDLMLDVGAGVGGPAAYAAGKTG